MKKIIALLSLAIPLAVYAEDELGNILNAAEFKRTSAPVDTTSGLNGESNAAALKIAFIDMNRLFTSFHETKAAEEKLNDARAEAKTELDNKLARLQEMMNEINAQNSRGRSDERLLQQARDLDKQIADFRSKREKILQNQFTEMRKAIIDKLNAIVRIVAEEHGLNVIYDRSGMSMGQVPVIIYTKGVFDITDACIEKSNSR
jgi:Skp family chaperone for outer membrane proteins